jgi:hypothetical protein
MKTSLHIILGLSILSVCSAMPTALIRYETKGEKSEAVNGVYIDRVIYQREQKIEFSISEFKSVETDEVVTVSELYFYEGQLVLQSNWSLKEKENDEDYGDVRTFQSSGDFDGLQVSTQDIDNDGLLDQVMIISDEFDTAAFKRNKEGAMLPITPLIVTEEGLIFFKEEKDEPGEVVNASSPARKPENTLHD